MPLNLTTGPSLRLVDERACGETSLPYGASLYLGSDCRRDRWYAHLDGSTHYARESCSLYKVAVFISVQTQPQLPGFLPGSDLIEATSMVGNRVASMCTAVDAYGDILWFTKVHVNALPLLPVSCRVVMY